ncbi:uncharacterized protein KY384_006505 [Bacidia gigantensis]|uniref:uncharacterized protein n=1 Tax=Bacidia gigantensis TaxID=2732470 RepID=UPI001D05890A|nr:uncharacterized protein KY384_006505 [Bacidia gigantensis]KAG8528816.1 hypothetical protein KY384_006505 [Bacidia gigantensis]
MDINHEIEHYDPDVPFRACSGYKHHTWAKTFHSYPEYYIQPRSIEELRKTIILARKCRRHITVTGCSHSPSDLTCTSSWLVNIDNLDQVLDMDEETGVVQVQSGIRLHDFGSKLGEVGLAMPNLGSIDHQSIAGAISTATHGSSLQHGLLSRSVLALKIMLADGTIASCSKEDNLDLFRASLVSLGAIGIITEITFQAVPAFNIEWARRVLPLSEVLGKWDGDLWNAGEFTRIWWMPYAKQCVIWSANKTTKPLRPPPNEFMAGKLGYHIYQALLYISNWVSPLVPLLERLLYKSQEGKTTTAVANGHSGLLMNCFFSQFVNEWAIPLNKGPEALSRLSRWLNGEEESGIPFSSKGLFVHAPIEVRITDSTSTKPRPYLDNTVSDGPTLYLNATLYRPYLADPPCRARYYEAFEWLMREMGGRPHWAKNFATITSEDITTMYPEAEDWVRIRNKLDPDGMFIGDWHRRLFLLGRQLPLEERLYQSKSAWAGGTHWYGTMDNGKPSPQGSDESFDLVDAEIKA